MEQQTKEKILSAFVGVWETQEEDMRNKQWQGTAGQWHISNNRHTYKNKLQQCNPIGTGNKYWDLN